MTATATAKRELRLTLCRRALALAQHPNVKIEASNYARKDGLGGTLTVCVLGGLTHEALSTDLLGSAQLDEGTVLEVAQEGALYSLLDAPGFVLDVLTLLWDVEDVALLETAFEGDLNYIPGKRIRLRSGNTSNLWSFYDEAQHPNTLSDQGDKNLLAQFDAARVLRQYVPDDTERYRRVLHNVINHGGIYNPWG